MEGICFATDAKLAQQTESRAKAKEEERRREADPLAAGRWVTLQGLQTARLNGCIGEIVAPVNGAAAKA